jgi:hypothetical protein
MGGPVEVEVERGITGDGVGAHDRVGDVFELGERAVRGHPGRERTLVVVPVDGVQADQPGLLRPWKQPVGRAHVEEARVTAAARQRTCVQHGRGRGARGVRVVGVEELEQTGTHVVPPRDTSPIASRISSVITKPESITGRSSAKQSRRPSPARATGSLTGPIIDASARASASPSGAGWRTHTTP